MALTETEQLYNLALSLVGEKRITTTTPATDFIYSLCAEHYPTVLKEVLTSHPWNEAIVRGALVEEQYPPTHDYTFRYELPADSLRFIGIDADTQEWNIEGEYLLTKYGRVPQTYSDDSVKYVAGDYLSKDDVTYYIPTNFTSSSWATDQLQLNSTGGDYKYIGVYYVSYLNDVSKFSPSLKKVVYYSLATNIVTALTNNPQLQEKLEILLEQKIWPWARSNDAQQGTPRPFFHSSFIRSRYE